MPPTIKGIFPQRRLPADNRPESHDQGAALFDLRENRHLQRVFFGGSQLAEHGIQIARSHEHAKTGTPHLDKIIVPEPIWLRSNAHLIPLALQKSPN